MTKSEKTCIFKTFFPCKIKELESCVLVRLLASLTVTAITQKLLYGFIYFCTEPGDNIGRRLKMQL